jgi:hypothetical protein
MGILGTAEPVDPSAKAHVIGEGLSKGSRWTPRGPSGRHVEKERTAKAWNHSQVA